jgi:hypothetical protein
MSAFDRLENFNLPPLIRRAADQHVARIESTQDLAQFDLA